MESTDSGKFYTLLSQRLSSWFGCVSSNPTDRELLGKSGIGENMLNNRGSLVTCSAKNSDDFGHGEDLDVNSWDV